MRIVNYKRFVFSVFLILILSSLCVNMVFSMVSYDQAPSQRFEQHQVARGETVWEIAKLYLEDQDIRDFVYEIAKANHLSNFVIMPGQMLLIPVH